MKETRNSFNGVRNTTTILVQSVNLYTEKVVCVAVECRSDMHLERRSGSEVRKTAVKHKQFETKTCAT